jgi:hypothetical protein
MEHFNDRVEEWKGDSYTFIRASSFVRLFLIMHQWRFDPHTQENKANDAVVKVVLNDRLIP